MGSIYNKTNVYQEIQQEASFQQYVNALPVILLFTDQQTRQKTCCRSNSYRCLNIRSYILSGTDRKGDCESRPTPATCHKHNSHRQHSRCRCAPVSQEFGQCLLHALKALQRCTRQQE